MTSPSEDGDRLIGVDPPVALDRERLAGVLVDDVQELQDPAVLGLVELEVERPDVVGALGAEAIGRHGRLPEALALCGAPGDPQAFLAPQPLDALAVELHPSSSRAPWAR